MSFQSEQQQRIAAAALRRYQALQRDECIDPNSLDSRPSKKQYEVFKAIQTIPTRVVVAGNRAGKCLVKGTKVATPSGPINIENLKPGDTVYSENGKEIQVVELFDEGIKEVVDLTHRNKVIASCPKHHRWLMYNQKSHKYEVRRIDQHNKEWAIVRQELEAPLGNINEPHAYVLGALLGDGCSRENGIVLSCGDEEVVNKCADILNTSVKRAHPNNHSWRLYRCQVNHYSEWCRNKYAHEKTVDMNIIKSWNRESLLDFMAGLIDTDGSIYKTTSSSGNKELSLVISMQAEEVIKAFQYGLLALWGIEQNITLDDRDKYKNGPLYCIKIHHNYNVKRILKELSSYLAIDRKKYKEEYNSISDGKFNPIFMGIKVGDTRQEHVYDIMVDSDTHLYTLANGLVTHNTTIGGREISWLIEDKHPYIKRNDIAKNKPLTILVLGQVGEQIESNLWREKIKPFLTPGTFKEVRIGNALQRVEFKDTSDRIIFISHHNASEARKTTQGYDAQYVWVDEMPNSLSLIAELQMRVMADKGRLLITFTPLLRNVDIKNWVEQETETKAKFKFNTLDNPIFKGREKEILAEFDQYPESERNARLYGDWYAGDLSVYELDFNKHIVDLPAEYSRTWDHIEAVDPAASGTMGYILLAQSPLQRCWYVVKSKYIKGAAATDLLDKLYVESAPYNIIKRVSDPHEVWFIKEASKRDIFYLGVYNKTQRKAELIKNVQHKLTEGALKICKDCTEIQQELVSAQWSETANDKIENSTKYHTLDALQYALDVLPIEKKVTRYVHSDPLVAHDMELRDQNKERKKAEFKAMKIKNAKGRAKWQKRFSYSH